MLPTPRIHPHPDVLEEPPPNVAPYFDKTTRHAVHNLGEKSQINQPQAQASIDRMDRESAEWRMQSLVVHSSGDRPSLTTKSPVLGGEPTPSEDGEGFRAKK